MIRKATIGDVKQIQELINHYAQQDKMMPRSLNEMYEKIRDFWVYEEKGKVIGCSALHVTWENLAEVRSLAVKPSHQGKGIGKNLLLASLDEAKTLGVRRVFVLTVESEFFEKNGFRSIDKSELPQKIWSECINCPKFPNCDEEALVIELTRDKKVASSE